jgi:hypothetical protein
MYPVRGKQGETRPQIIARQIMGDAPEALDGSTLLYTASVEIACTAYQQYDTAVALYEAVRASLYAMRKQTVAGHVIQKVQISSVRDDDNPQTDWLAVIFTVVISHKD